MSTKLRFSPALFSGFGALEDSTLVAKKILRSRHQLVASPEYLKNAKKLKKPQDLLDHHLLSFSFWNPQASWTFFKENSKSSQTITFYPYLSMNDHAGLAKALISGAGIGKLPPIISTSLLNEGKLIEVMPTWHFQAADISVVHLSNRHIPRAVRLFKDFSAQLAPKLFKKLPE